MIADLVGGAAVRQRPINGVLVFNLGYDSNHLMQAMTDANGDQGADQSKRRHAAEAAIDGGVELAEFFRHLGSSTDASEGFRADQERRAPSWRT